jgi:hypothetical protein
MVRPISRRRGRRDPPGVSRKVVSRPLWFAAGSGGSAGCRGFPIGGDRSLLRVERGNHPVSFAWPSESRVRWRSDGAFSAPLVTRQSRDASS